MPQLLLVLHLLTQPAAPAQPFPWARVDLLPRASPKVTSADLALAATGDPRPRKVRWDESLVGAGGVLGGYALTVGAIFAIQKLGLPTQGHVLTGVEVAAGTGLLLAVPAAATVAETLYAGPHAGSWQRAALYGYGVRVIDVLAAALMVAVVTPALPYKSQGTALAVTGVGFALSELVVMPMAISAGLHGAGPWSTVEWHAKDAKVESATAKSE